MNFIYRAKIRKLYTGKTLFYLIVGLGFLIVLVYNNHYSNIIALNTVNIFNVTAEYALLFVPLGMVMIYHSFDSRNVYCIRFPDREIWLKKEIAFMTAALAMYTTAYSVLAVLVDSVNIALTYDTLPQVDLWVGSALILLCLRRFAFLMLLLFLSMIIYVANAEKTFLTILFATYLGLLITQLAETFLYGENVILRPILDTDASLLGNFIYALPMISATVVAALVWNYFLRSDHQ